MGEHAEDILNGDVDEQTGEWIGGGQGFPRSLQKQIDRKKENLSIPVLAVIQKKLADNNYTIIKLNNIDYGYQIRTLSGAIINIYTSGKVVIQGKKDEKLIELLK